MSLTEWGSSLVFTSDPFTAIIVSGLSLFFEEVFGIDPLGWLFGQETRISAEKEAIEDFWKPIVTEWHNQGMPQVGAHFNQAADARSDLQKDPNLWRMTQIALQDAAGFCPVLFKGKQCPEGFDERFVYQLFWNLWGDGWTYKMMADGWAATMMGFGFQSKLFAGTTKWDPYYVITWGDKYNAELGYMPGPPPQPPPGYVGPKKSLPVTPYDWSRALGQNWDPTAKRWVPQAGYPHMVFHGPTNQTYYIQHPYGPAQVDLALRFGPAGFHPDITLAQMFVGDLQPLTPPPPTPGPEPPPPPQPSPSGNPCDSPCVKELQGAVAQLQSDLARNWEYDRNTIYPLASQAKSGVDIIRQQDLPQLRQQDQLQTDWNRAQDARISQEESVRAQQDRAILDHVNRLNQQMRDFVNSEIAKVNKRIDDIVNKTIPDLNKRLVDLTNSFNAFVANFTQNVTNIVNNIISLTVTPEINKLWTFINTTVIVRIDRCCQAIESLQRRRLRCITLNWCQVADQHQGMQLDCYFEDRADRWAPQFTESYPGDDFAFLTQARDQIRRLQTTGPWLEDFQRAMRIRRDLRTFKPTFGLGDGLTVSPRVTVAYSPKMGEERRNATFSWVATVPGKTEVDPCSVPPPAFKPAPRNGKQISSLTVSNGESS